MAQINIEETKEQARELLDSRIESVTELVKKRQRVSELQTELAAAEKEAKRAYARATKGGWTADELKKLGLEDNVATRRRNAASKRSSRTTNSSAGSSPQAAADVTD